MHIHYSYSKSPSLSISLPSTLPLLPPRIFPLSPITLAERDDTDPLNNIPPFTILQMTSLPIQMTPFLQCRLIIGPNIRRMTRHRPHIRISKQETDLLERLVLRLGEYEVTDHAV